MHTDLHIQQNISSCVDKLGILFKQKQEDKKNS